MDGDELDAYLSVKVKEARIKALDEAAATVCGLCFHKYPIAKADGSYYHPRDDNKDDGPHCHADAIQKLKEAD